MVPVRLGRVPCGPMYATTREFVEALERASEIVRVAAPVSPILEIAAIADRVSKSHAAHLPSPGARASDPRFHGMGGSALLFENVEGADMPVLINALGSYRRMEIALGCHEAVPGFDRPRTASGFDGIAERIAELIKPNPPRTMREAIAALRKFAPIAKIGPKRRHRAGPCQEIVWKGEAADIRRLPMIRCWPLDGDLAAVGYPPDVNDGIDGIDARDRDLRGRYITFGGVHTIHARDEHDPRPASHNIGMYRVQALGPRRMAMHWHMHHDGAAHWRSWKARNRPMPVAIALGGESVLPYAATCPLPPGISELLMAGFLQGRGIEMCRAATVPVWVPANAEIVIEGYVSHEAGCIGWDPRDPDAGPLGPGAVFEGPFGDHTGFYSLPDRYPILEVTAITHRRDPIYPTTIVGLPPQEDYYLGKATERIMRPLLKTIMPDVEDYDLPMFGAFHNAAALTIDKQYPLQGRRAMHGVWGAGQMAWTKNVFVVDTDIDVHDSNAVLKAAAERCCPAHDVERVRGPLDILDHAAPHLGAGSKVGFDCTRKTPDERPIDPCAQWTALDDASALELLEAMGGIASVRGATLPEALGRGWLIVSIDKAAGGDGQRVIAEIERIGGSRTPPYVIVVGPEVDPEDTDTALFHWCAHTDAGRDAALFRVPGPHDGTRAVLAFDATPKMPGDERNGEPVRQWPPIIEMPLAIRERIEARWMELGLGDGPVG